MIQVPPKSTALVSLNIQLEPPSANFNLWMALSVDDVGLSDQDTTIPSILADAVSLSEAVDLPDCAFQQLCSLIASDEGVRLLLRGSGFGLDEFVKFVAEGLVLRFYRLEFFKVGLLLCDLRNHHMSSPFRGQT